MSFSTIPVRTNGPQILASWFNALRTAGMALESFLGGGFIGATEFTIANGQASAANVTGLSFSGASYRTVVIYYQVYRNTTGGSGVERVQSGMMIANYKTVAATWEITMGPAVGDAGVEFSITSAGQVQYVSDTQAGTPATSKMTFTSMTMGV